MRTPTCSPQARVYTCISHRNRPGDQLRSGTEVLMRQRLLVAVFAALLIVETGCENRATPTSPSPSVSEPATSRRCLDPNTASWSVRRAVDPGDRTVEIRTVSSFDVPPWLEGNPWRFQYGDTLTASWELFSPSTGQRRSLRHTFMHGRTQRSSGRAAALTSSGRVHVYFNLADPAEVSVPSGTRATVSVAWRCV